MNWQDLERIVTNNEREVIFVDENEVGGGCCPAYKA